MFVFTAHIGQSTIYSSSRKSLGLRREWKLDGYIQPILLLSCLCCCVIVPGTLALFHSLDPRFFSVIFIFGLPLSHSTDSSLWPLYFNSTYLVSTYLSRRRNQDGHRCACVRVLMKLGRRQPTATNGQPHEWGMIDINIPNWCPGPQSKESQRRQGSMKLTHRTACIC